MMGNVSTRSDGTENSPPRSVGAGNTPTNSKETGHAPPSSLTTPVTPTISVVIPTYRRPEALARCLDALAVQTFSEREFEVIVVDDGSGAPPHAVVERMASRLTITLLTREHGGPGAARNTGVAAARGARIAFVDDDCLPEPDWLTELVRVSALHDHALVAGRVENALIGNPFAEASQLLTSWLVQWYSHPDRYARLTFTTNNMLFAREQFESLGGFDTTSLADTAEDRDLCDRWRVRGWPLVRARDAVVKHAHRMSLDGFVAQHHNYGRGAVYFHKAAGRVPSEARKPETPRFYFGLLRFPFSQHGPLRAIGYALLLLLAQVVYVWGYFSERLLPVKQVRA